MRLARNGEKKVKREGHVTYYFLSAAPGFQTHSARRRSDSAHKKSARKKRAVEKQRRPTKDERGSDRTGVEMPVYLYTYKYACHRALHGLYARVPDFFQVDIPACTVLVISVAVRSTFWRSRAATPNNGLTGWEGVAIVHMITLARVNCIDGQCNQIAR